MQTKNTLCVSVYDKEREREREKEGECFIR